MKEIVKVFNVDHRSRGERENRASETDAVRKEKTGEERVSRI